MADAVKPRNGPAVTHSVRKGSRDRWREMAPAWLDVCASGHAWNAIGRPFGGCFEASATRSSGRPLAAGAAASASAGCTDLAKSGTRPSRCLCPASAAARASQAGEDRGVRSRVPECRSVHDQRRAVPTIELMHVVRCGCERPFSPGFPNAHPTSILDLFSRFDRETSFRLADRGSRLSRVVASYSCRAATPPVEAARRWGLARFGLG